MSIKYIFSINSGHSGSDYLAELLACANNTVSLHEGFPVMNGLPMIKFNNGDESFLRDLTQLKFKQIKKSIGKQNKIYCETNHSYIKGWGFIIPEYIPQEEIAVIILRRNISEVVHSLLRAHVVPGSNQFNRTWYLSPFSKGNISSPAENAAPYDLCKWYITETFLRAEEYQKTFPKITYIECDIQSLNDIKFVLNLFQKLGLNSSKKLNLVCGKPINKREEWPHLEMKELLELSPYPNIDSLQPKEKDNLLNCFLYYIKENNLELINSMKPDYTMGATFAPAAISIVAKLEKELEEHFNFSLKYSDMENYLILELVRFVSPNDFVFFFSDRLTQPHICYTFNYNLVPSLSTVISKFGLTSIPRIIKIALKGMWGRDYTHRLSKT